MDEKEKLVSRMENLEESVRSLKEETLEVKSTVNELKSIVEDISRSLISSPRSFDKPRIGSFGGQIDNQSKVNPWTEEVQYNIMKALESLKRRPSAEFSKETFGPTIEALKKKKEGMTASEVGECTGRQRNTESFYLKRLYLAGITRRWVRGREVLYALTSDREIIKKYPDLM